MSLMKKEFESYPFLYTFFFYCSLRQLEDAVVFWWPEEYAIWLKRVFCYLNCVCSVDYRYVYWEFESEGMNSETGLNKNSLRNIFSDKPFDLIKPGSFTY